MLTIHNSQIRRRSFCLNGPILPSTGNEGPASSTVVEHARFDRSIFSNSLGHDGEKSKVPQHDVERSIRPSDDRASNSTRYGQQQGHDMLVESQQDARAT